MSNGSGNAVVAVNGAAFNPPTLLGRGALRIPTAGKIRAGIQVLTKIAAANPKAKEIYEHGVLNDRPFEEIEKEITNAVPELKSPLTPRNIPWFTVRPQDFPNPALAKEILRLYGEDRGDGKTRLYRFPVVWPSDHWQVVMPHELAAWNASGKRFWSEYTQDGETRLCMTYAPVAVDPGTKRAIRVFGGRKTQPRKDNDGVCDPERCPEYQRRECNLSGRFIFYIPGIPSLDAIELHTSSWYAVGDAIEKFKAISFMRGGRLSGFLDGKQATFYLTKTLKEVSHIDNEGQPRRVKQWIVTIEAPVDVTALLAAPAETALAAADEAIEVLQGSTAHANGQVIEGQATRVSAEPDPMQPKGATDTARDGVRSTDAPTTDTKRPGAASSAPMETSATAQTGQPTLEQIFDAATEFGITRERYEAYADKLWGRGWKLNPAGRRKALAEIERFKSDPDGFISKIDAELTVFA